MLRLTIAALLTSLVPLVAQDVNPAGERFPEVALTKAAKAGAVAAALGDRLPAIAKWYGVAEADLRATIQRDRSLSADKTGRLVYACAGIVPVDGAEVNKAADEPQAINYPLSETFLLHSRPNAVRKIYLDFDGHTTSGTTWNNNITGGADFTTPPYDIDGAAGFSNTELSRIQNIWKRVVEDFAPYEVDVTTEDPGVEALRRTGAGDNAYGIRVCIGGSSYDWYGAGAGGVAYLGSFNWNSDAPCFVFPDQLGGGNEGYTAEATSHEVGHTLGLAHDGQTNGTEYYSGHGNWAPIMGVGYGKTIVQWSKGEYSLANNTQDDTTVMQNYGAPLRADEAGDNAANAEGMTDFVVPMEGVISTRADRDFYAFSTLAGPITFSVTSPSVSPDLDVLLTLYDVSGNTVATSDPATLSATLNATVPTGTYYLAVEGSAPGNPTTNYNDYGSLGAYELTGLYISDAENYVSVVATDAEAAETPKFAPANTGTFTFSRLVVNPIPLVIPFTVSGTAIDGTDYAMAATVTIPSGDRSATIVVAPIDDAVGDGTKTVIVTLSPSGSYNLAPAKEATVSIRDNELPRVGIASPQTEVVENSATALKLTVFRDAAIATPLTVNLNLGGSAVPGVDYDAFPTTVTIPANEANYEIEIKPNDNDFYNETRTVSVSVAMDPEYEAAFISTANLRILNDEPTPDGKKPSVTIASPKALQRFDAPAATLVASGSARDNLAVTGVKYRLNGGFWANATVNGGTWSADLGSQLFIGENLLEVKGEDDDSNESAIVAARFTVVQRRNLQVTVSGPGAVTPDTGTYEAMQQYTLRAKPQLGKIFAGWTGDLSASGKVLSFTMPDADVQLTATFVDSPFAFGVIGKYNGLLRGSPATAPGTSGMISLSITSTGIATGKLWINGKQYPVKGEFNGTGRLDTTVAVKKQAPMQVSLFLDLNPNGTQSVTGTVTTTSGTANVQASRAPYDAKKNPLTSDFARSYTFYLPGVSDGPTPGVTPLPQGFGAGTLSINAGGVVKWVGTLNDGTPATQTTMLDAQKRWPLYVSLYKGRGFISGDVIHNPAAAETDLSATVNWAKLPIPTDRYFPDGFSVEGHELLGVNYTAPLRGQPAISGLGTAAPLTLTHGNLSGAGFAGSLTLSPTNAFQITSSAEKLKLSVNVRTGALTGSFLFPITRKSTPIKGVILQGKIGKGVGFFPGTTLFQTALQTGRLEFAPAP